MTRAVLALVLLVVPACSGLKVDGECVYVRRIETSYTCKPGATLEHTRIAPGIPEP